MFSIETLTLLGVIVAIAGVVATLIAPRFSRSTRLSFEIADIFEIRSETPASSLSIVVQHEGQVVDEQVFVVRCLLRNSGTTDISTSHFVDPIEIVLPDAIEILSLEVDADLGIKPEVSHDAHTAFVRWTLLKAREDIEISLIVKANSQTSETGLAQQIREVVRLVNVKVGPGFWASHPALRNALIGVGLGTVALGALVIIVALIPDNGMLVVETEAGPRAIFQATSSTPSLCEIYSDPVLIGHCDGITRQELALLLPSARLGGGFTGAPPPVWWLVGATVILCGALGALMGHTFNTLSRVRRRLTVMRG